MDDTPVPGEAASPNDGVDADKRRVLRQRLAARSAERIKELRAKERPLEPGVPEYVPPPPPRPPTLPASGYVALGLVVIALAGAVYAGGKAVMNGARDLREKQLAWVNRDAGTADDGRDQAFNETDAVTLCDLNMQSQAISRSAYRSDWSWRVEQRNGVMAVRRGFSVSNPYGVDMSGQYTCLVGEATNRIVGLQYEVGGLTVTVPGSELQQ